MAGSNRRASISNSTNEKENLRFDVRDGVAYIVLCRSESRNAIDLAMTRELMHAAIECDEDSNIRAVCLTAKGEAFSVGGDIKSFVEAGGNLASLMKEMTTYLHAAISRFARMNAPVVVAVNGVAAGGGFGLICAADLVIAAESARFCAAFTNSGLSPDSSTTYFLPRLIGWRRASELLITNRMLSAKEALEWNLVNQVVADEDLLSKTQELAIGVASGATLAYGAVKKLLLASAAETLESQMESEARSIAQSAHTRDSAEGIRAFIEKRLPTYEGR